MKVKTETGESRPPFSMLETRMWTDEKFVKLSRMQPSGQALWIYLLSGPHTAQTRMVPGVYVVSRAALAEQLGWEIEEFDAVFSQIFGRKMAVADWERQILWLPNALKRHMPRSPDNILGWRTGWELIPDCPLKRRIYRAMKAAIFGRGEAFAKAFDQAIKPAAHGSAGSEPIDAKSHPSSRSRSTHQRADGSKNAPAARDAGKKLRSTHNPKDGPPIKQNKGGPYTDVDVDVDVDTDGDNPKVKTGNGAPAPFPPRVRVRARKPKADPMQAPPDNPLSEFASVRRLHAMHTQGELLDGAPRKPAPNKARAIHPAKDGPTIAANMGAPDGTATSNGKSRKAASDKARGPDTGPTWNAYSEAYAARYGVEPVRNAIVNSQMLHFVERVGAVEAPEVARFFVHHGSGFYVRRSHAVGLLLQDAESLRTQWATQRPVTATEAAMADRTATNANAFGPLIAEARERERIEAEHGRQ